MKRRHYQFFDINIPTTVYTKVIKRGGAIIRLPLFWIYQDVYIYYPDSYIELKTVLFNSNNNAYVPIAAMYLNSILTCRLKNDLPYLVDTINRYI